MSERFKNDRIIVKTGLACCPESISAVQLPYIDTLIFAQGIKVKLSLKIRTEYCVIIGCNHVLSVAREVKLSYVGYCRIHYSVCPAGVQIVI